MNKGTPFAFNFDGYSAKPVFEPFVSHHAVNTLKNYQAQNEKEKQALQALFDFLPHLLMFEDAGGKDLKSGDVPESEFKSMKPWELKSKSYRSKSKYYGTIGPGDLRSNFNPEHDLPITANPQDWGWGNIKDVLPHASVLRKIAKQLDITLRLSFLNSVQGYFERLNEDIFIRQSNPLNDLGKTFGYATYYPGKGYTDIQGYSNTLDKVRLHPNIEAARARGAVVVKIEISAVEACDPTNDAGLLEALSSLQNERIQHALQHMEIEALRARLKELEESTLNTSKKRM